MAWMRQVIAATLGLIVFTTSAHAETDVTTHLQQFSQRLHVGESIHVFERPIHAKSIVADFFQVRGFQPVWYPSEQAERVLAELHSANDEGLEREDYHYHQLRELYSRLNNGDGDSDYQRAQFELLMTDAVLLYAFHLINGKVDPSDFETTWNYARRELIPAEAISRLNQYASDNTVVSALQALKPQHDFYRELKNSLQVYRQLALTHAYEPITPTPLLHLNQSYEVIPALSLRLQQLGFYDATAEADGVNANIYTPELQSAVKAFQVMHGLQDDGVVGQQTWAMLNLSYQQRVDKIRINMERTRWVNENLAEDFVVVNIAGFNLHLVRNNERIWSTDVMTGTVNHETPVFTSRITYMEFNPTWTVPRSILRRTLINKFKANPQSVIDKQFHLLNREGEVVDPLTLDWQNLSANNFPYTAVQQPSDINALGQVKFMFPNAHAIYLHDTPAKALFSKSARAFSSGCVRVKEPFKFAQLLMDQDDWTPERIDAVVASQERTHVSLPVPIDVMLMYWTVEPADEGKVKFNPDIYNRDEQVLAALDEALF